MGTPFLLLFLTENNGKNSKNETAKSPVPLCQQSTGLRETNRGQVCVFYNKKNSQNTQNKLEI